MYYVNLLRSQPDRTRTDVGFTANLRQRFKAHHWGKSTHTTVHRPWRLETYLAFTCIQKARNFERYLKSPSGIALANKQLRQGLQA